MRSSKPRPLKRYGLYGWYILGASFLILFFSSGARMSFGVIFKPMLDEFGWSRGLLSSAFFLNMTVFSLSLTVVGRFYDRYGPKWVIIIFTLFLSAGFILTALATSPWQFFLSYGVIAAIGLGGTSGPLVAALMSKWFNKWRGLAISLALCGNSVGQFVLIPLFTRFVLDYDWRASYLWIALMMLVTNITLALLVIRGDPEDIGQRPIGTQDESTAWLSDRSPNRQDLDLGLWDSMRTSSFWLFLGSMFVCGGGDFLVVAHLIPMVTDYGLSTTTGGYLLAWHGLMSFGGLVLAGYTSDVMGNKLPIALTFLFRFGLFLLILVYPNPISFYIFALAFGFTHLITLPLTSTLVGKLYGLSHIGLISGVILMIHNLSGGFWAYIGGVIFDRTGSYQLAFLLSAILVLIGFVCIMLIAEKRHYKASATI